MILTPAAESCWLVKTWTGASGARVQRRRTPNASCLVTWGLKQSLVIPQTLTRIRFDTQVLEGPNIGDIRSLLNMLLAIDTQVLEGPIPAISGPAQHAARRNKTLARLQLHVA